MKTLRTAQKLLTLCALLCAATLWLGNEECAPSAASTDAQEAPALPAETEAALRSAMANLATHDLRGARRDFNFALQRSPESGQARLGAALTRLLLLPEEPPVVALARDLGGEPVLWQEAVFSEGGLLDTLANDDDDARRDDALDRLLPWPRALAEEPARIADALPPDLTFNALIPHLEGAADALEAVAGELHAGLQAPDFTPFVFPLTTFHGATRIVLGASEVLVLEGGLRLGAAALRWLTAYDWPQRMGALDSQSTRSARVHHLNEGALRAVTRPAALPQAQDQLALGLQRLRLALELAPLGQGSLRLEQLPEAANGALQRLLGALEAALTRPTPLPDTRPPATLALAPLFAGRALSPDLNLLRAAPGEDGEEEISLDYNGLRDFLLRDVLSPDCDLDPDAPANCPTFQHEGQDLLDLSEQISAPLQRNIEEDYR